MSKKKQKSTYDDFLVSEMLVATMERDGISVRELAKEAGVSPTVVQGIRSGTRENVTVKSLLKILGALGYRLKAEKEDGDVSVCLCM